MPAPERNVLCWVAMDTPKASADASPAAAAALESARLSRLLARIADGDQVAFADFYQATSRRVYGMARRVLIDQGLSEDTCQEVFLQVWQLAGKFDPSAGSPLAWVMTIAHRRAIDRVRSVQSAADREERVFALGNQTGHDSVSEEVETRLEAEAVVRCLETLTATQQESVRLAYYDGLSYREVADRLGAALPTIKSRIRDGLIRLKTCLGVV